MEAVQFHPTGIFPAGILVTEGCRGDGGLLKDVDGHRFMPDYEPEKKELASRDVVSRRMEEHIRKGKGVQVALRRAPLARHHAARRAAHREQPARGQGDLPVLPRHRPDQGLDRRCGPAQHYTMGGVRTDHTGESPTLKGLFAAGEAACWDMHGFNRLGGNSVAETVVAGMIVGEFVADFCDRADNDVDIPTGAGARVRRRASRPSSTRWSTAAAPRTPRRCACAMQEIMTAKVGIFRTGDDLAGGGRRAAGTAGAQPQHRPAPQGARRQPRARHRLPRAEDAQAGAVRGLRRARAHREPRRALPRGLPAPRRRAVAEAHAGHLEGRGRHAADAGLRAARRRGDGAAARLARLRREGLRRPPGHAGARRRSRRRCKRAAGRRAALRGAAGADALRRRCCPQRCAGATNASTSRLRTSASRSDPDRDGAVTIGRRSRQWRRDAATRGCKIRVLRFNPQRARRARRTCRPTSSRKRPA